MRRKRSPSGLRNRQRAVSCRVIESPRHPSRSCRDRTSRTHRFMPADPATAASPWTVTTAAPGAGEPNYDAIYAAVVATAQGRWFLAQYASRNRNADTAQLLAAIDRLQTEAGRSASPAAAEPGSPPGPDIARLRRDLGELAEALIRAR